MGKNKNRVEKDTLPERKPIDNVTSPESTEKGQEKSYLAKMCGGIVMTSSDLNHVEKKAREERSCLSTFDTRHPSPIVLEEAIV